MKAILSNFFNYIKNSNHHKFILLILLVIFVFISFKQCDDNKHLKSQMQQNQYALTDTIHQLRNKNNELFNTKAITVSKLNELKDLNKDLFDEVSKMKGKVAEISKINTKIVYVDRPIQSSIIKYANNNYSIFWKDSTKYSDYYRQLLGETKLQIDSTNGKIIDSTIKTIILKDSTNFKLITGIWKNNNSNKWEIFVKNSNPNMTFDLEGHIIEDEINKISSVPKESSKFSINLYTGIGTSENFKPEFQIGVGFSYRLVELNFWPFK